MALHPVVGHEDVRSTLAAAFTRGSLPASLLLHGPRGVGKQHLGLWTARLAVCTDPSSDGPCDLCGPCRMALSLEHPDIHWYMPLERPKASGDRLVDALEDARLQAIAERRADSLAPSGAGGVRGLYLGAIRGLRSKASKRPTMADGPVFLVGDAELMVPQEASPEAANALLKLLEEPPGAARFILTSSEPGLLLPTIRSRTVPMHVGGLPERVVSDFLVERRGVDEKTAGWAASLARGSIGRALGFLPDGDDPGPLEEQRRDAHAIVAAAVAPTGGQGYRVALSYPPSRARALLDLLAFVEEWVRDLGAVAAGSPDRLFNTDARKRLERWVSEKELRAVDVPVAFAAIERSRELAKGNVNPQLVIAGLIRDLRAALAVDRRSPAHAAP